jgi:hypothetical protein
MVSTRIFAAVALVSACSAFIPVAVRPSRSLARNAARATTALRMSSEDEPGSIVAVTPANIEAAAGVTGGIVGLWLGGPLFAVIFAAATNYGSKQDGDIPDAVRQLGSSAIGVFNFLTEFNAKYDVTGKAGELGGQIAEKAKASDTSGTFDKVESVLKDTTAKVSELNVEYDLVSKSKSVAGYASELAEKAIDKGRELDAEYELSNKAVDAVKSGVEKARKNV